MQANLTWTKSLLSRGRPTTFPGYNIGHVNHLRKGEKKMVILTCVLGYVIRFIQKVNIY